MSGLRRCVVIGASAGGVEALREVVARLPGGLAVPVFVVLHIPPYVASSLPQILGRSGPLRAVHPRDGAVAEAGVIYVAPPDHHLLLDGRHVAVKKGPKENRFRPSIDALFRSAAYTCGPGAIGVVLSGMLDDGTSGLWSVERLGGTTVIQEPNEARFEDMPRSAMNYVRVDHNLPSTQIGALIGRLVGQARPAAAAKGAARHADDKARMKKELEIAAENSAYQKGVMELGKLTPFTCPECHGVLVRIAEGKMSRFRCHTGHAYTDSALLEAVMEFTGEALWQVIRSFEESLMLLDHMGRHLKEAGDPGRARTFFAKARELEKRSRTFHEAVLEHESLSGDNLGQEPAQ